MPKFIILSGSIIDKAGVHAEGSEIELSLEHAAAINKKGKKLEPVELRDAKAKANADAKKAIEQAEADAKAKAKGGGK